MRMRGSPTGLCPGSGKNRQRCPVRAAIGIISAVDQHPQSNPIHPIQLTGHATSLGWLRMPLHFSHLKMPRHISTSGPTRGTGGPLCGDTVIKCDGSMGEDEQSPAHRVTHDWGGPTNTAIPRELNNQGLPIIPPDQPQLSRKPVKKTWPSASKGHKHTKSLRTWESRSWTGLAKAWSK